MMRRFKADLHVHTCLSPCADLEMTPSAIISAAVERGIDIIAITDHNSAENVIAAKKAAEDTSVTVLAGMEITSVEEAHVLALMEDVEGIMKIQDVVYENLTPGENIPPLPPFDKGKPGGFFQVVVNEKDEVLDFNKRLLIGATSLSVQEILNTIHLLGGLAVASHIDREAFGIISQLGFIPRDMKLDALELSPNTGMEKARRLFGEYGSFTWITSSDAHCLRDLGRRTTGFFMKQPTLEEMILAFKNIDGRKTEWGRE
ncbi:MAG: PHP domain-containing protein [Nitrospirae bacterium]|nr:PHP domain-containing protein [Nitrospirota bacterium]